MEATGCCTGVSADVGEAALVVAAVVAVAVVVDVSSGNVPPSVLRSSLSRTIGPVIPSAVSNQSWFFWRDASWEERGGKTLLNRSAVRYFA